jgi:hypothetical protein
MTGRRAVLRATALGSALAAAALLTAADAAAAPTPSPRLVPITTPGGLRPGAATELPTCVSEKICTIVKDTNPGDPSCTGYSSQTKPPATIRVLVRTGDQTGTYTITDVPFQQYVENVLPDEWVPSWDGDALKAGAVAVKSYGWYWVTHYGGYVNATHACFDVTDDFLFQTYLPGSASPRTDAAVRESWPVVARVNGEVFQASYQSFLHSSAESCGAYANGSVLSQSGSQNCVEENTGNKYNVILQRYYYPGLQLATAGQLRTPHDFTFEQTSTRATFDRGQWAIDDGYGTTFRFGATGDVPVITDSGDGFAHIGVWRASTGMWYLASPTGAIATRLQWGARGDIPVPAHYAGAAQPSVPAVYRPSSFHWYVHGVASVQYGAKGDIPVPADYNGDGTTDIAVFRPSNGTWYVRGGRSVQYGTKGDIPVPADYNGDGTTDIAVFRPSNDTWYVRGSHGVQYGARGDVPVTGDFTGDGRADIAVYRPSTQRWYVAGHAGAQFGAPGVTPIGAAPYRG